tara:strand:- start:861 stop:1079 length:219 start_codon:yes stop_codon:yes gene_type:complete
MKKRPNIPWVRTHNTLLITYSRPYGKPPYCQKLETKRPKSYKLLISRRTAVSIAIAFILFNIINNTAIVQQF